MNRTTTASHLLPVAKRTPTRRGRATWLASLLSAGLLLAGCGGADENANLEAASALAAAGAASAAEPDPKPTCDRSPTAQRGCIVP